jgi:glycosyltransferase involved in cell wall biosynthesis
MKTTTCCGEILRYTHRIAVITATYNAADHLPRLVASLRAQTSKNFEWVVADGGSTDGTLKILSQVCDLNLIVDLKTDFGIYDGLNRAIKLSSGDYYLVLGADDVLDPDSIKIFHQFIEKKTPDFVAALVRTDCGHIIRPEKKWKWFYSQRAYIGAHAVGTLIKKSLHDKHGMYSKKFPIAADQFFIKKACDSGAKVVYADFIAGVFSTSGISSSDRAGLLTESFRVQIRTGESKIVQLCLLIVRLIKNFKHL